MGCKRGDLKGKGQDLRIYGDVSIRSGKAIFYTHGGSERMGSCLGFSVPGYFVSGLGCDLTHGLFLQVPVFKHLELVGFME